MPVPTSSALTRASSAAVHPRYLHEQVSAQTNRPALVFSDEVQKSELIFDAVKPFTIDANDKVKYRAGEIDFVVSMGKRMIPLEAKAGLDRSQVDISLLVDFIGRRGVAFGIVAYGGLPHWDKRNRVLYWPYWLI